MDKVRRKKTSTMAWEEVCGTVSYWEDGQIRRYFRSLHSEKAIVWFV